MFTADTLKNNSNNNASDSLSEGLQGSQSIFDYLFDQNIKTEKQNMDCMNNSFEQALKISNDSIRSDLCNNTSPIPKKQQQDEEPISDIFANSFESKMINSNESAQSQNSNTATTEMTPKKNYKNNFDWIKTYPSPKETKIRLLNLNDLTNDNSKSNTNYTPNRSNTQRKSNIRIIKIDPSTGANTLTSPNPNFSKETESPQQPNFDFRDKIIKPISNYPPLEPDIKNIEWFDSSNVSSNENANLETSKRNSLGANEINSINKIPNDRVEIGYDNSMKIIPEEELVIKDANSIIIEKPLLNENSSFAEFTEDSDSKSTESNPPIKHHCQFEKKLLRNIRKLNYQYEVGRFIFYTLENVLSLIHDAKLNKASNEELAMHYKLGMMLFNLLMIFVWKFKNISMNDCNEFNLPFWKQTIDSELYIAFKKKIEAAEEKYKLYYTEFLSEFEEIYVKFHEEIKIYDEIKSMRTSFVDYENPKAYINQSLKVFLNEFIQILIKKLENIMQYQERMILVILDCLVLIYQYEGIIDKKTKGKSHYFNFASLYDNHNEMSCQYFRNKVKVAINEIFSEMKISS